MSSADETDDPNLVILPVESHLSDGDESKHPPLGGPLDYRKIDDTRWRMALATMWVNKTGAQEEGRTKAEMEAARASENQGSLTITPRLRDSISEDDDDADEPYDKDGPDYWKIHINRLKEKTILDEEIHHPRNLDWVLTHEWLTDYFVRLKLQAAFIPRRGEVVLWTHELSGQLEWNAAAKCYMVHKDDKWIVPEWRAGIITQIPEETTSFLDITQVTSKANTSVSYWGFRVETLPDPIGDDKSLSLQYKYVPLSCIKPFNTFERYLYGVPRESLHPSIEFAMTTMASWSLLSHTRFTGTWPNARLYSRGIFIGSELLAIQDAVRLKPFGFKQEDMEENGAVKHPEHDPVDVMIIEKIWLQLTKCNDNLDDPQLAQECTPFIAGKVYTRDPNRLTRHMQFQADPLEKMTFDEVSNAFRQVGMSNYGDWYRVAGGRTCAVSPPMILGRCYEPEATMLHFGSYRLDYDLHGTLNGRRYSSEVDTRIPEGVDWFWGDYRAETLGLATSNGVEVGDSAEQRENPSRWQAILRILDGSSSAEDIKQAEFPRRVGRPSIKKFGNVGKTSSLVSTGLGEISRSTSSDQVDDSMMDDMDDNSSEADLTLAELLAPVPFRGGTEETEGGDYHPPDE
ncbi:hypothetical protein N7456_003008 [Penicillium angulare]|uniref:Cryptic loci regulator 2 C-terminal domain-containing protein n=1 Tax=Penicillium angulare TaxID=116970 RepID=A0A9W9KI69_9EURO|nr:hypothetical protein N7456_003008 [Penicillium angulare]